MFFPDASSARAARSLFRLVPCAAAALLAAPAMAQSQAIVSGMVDAGVRSVHNGDAGGLRSVVSGAASSSRLAVRVTEDIGNGFKAGAWLEHGLATDTGASSDTARFWGRRSTVSLSHTSLGEVRLGRDYTPTYSVLVASDPFGDVGLGAVTSTANVLGSGALTFARADNLVSYLSPLVAGGGFAQLSAAPGEGATGTRYVGGLAGWRGERWRVMGGHGSTRGSLDDYTQSVLHAQYDFGVAKLMAGWLRGSYRASRQQMLTAAVSVPVGPHEIRASYVSADMRGPAVTGLAVANADDSNRLALGYLYNFSKRTSVYATAAQLRNEGNARVTLPGGPAGMKVGQTSRGFEAGLRHAF